jgi:tRNA-modifying protein YgfZ
MPELDLSMPRARLAQVREGATVVLSEPAVFSVAGTGALTCLQGLLTNDLVKPGDASIVYGALLTPKGMIVVDAWVLRRGDVLTMIVPRSGREAALELFRRSIPPRLARVSDLSDAWRVAWIVGAHAFHTLAQSGLPTPDGAGRVLAAPDGESVVALAPETAPFVAMFAGPTEEVAALAGRAVGAGAREGDETDLHAARILGGWPALGLEIDERTLPQEVRYDEIGGVSYTKGCYTGQETVARLHFRGHTNRELRGLLWSGAAAPEGRAVVAGGKEVGTVRSTLTLEDRTLGLALLRHEVEPGGEVVAGGRQATVIRLPFAVESLEFGR